MHLDGSSLSFAFALPFLGILLSIAIVPLTAPAFWSRHYGKVSLGWSLIALSAIAVAQGTGVSLYALIEVMFDQFIPFIIVLLSLFTITGGIKIYGKLGGTPVLNTIIILLGCFLANWLGTTGAAVLLIRPILAANAWRKFKLHTIIFFIFLVSNIAGSLTPVGNPPLLMGFICKVNFFWPLTKLFPPTVFSVFVLSAIYLVLDTFFYTRETAKPAEGETKAIRVKGKINFILLIGVVFAVLLSSLDLGTAFALYHVKMPVAELLEIGALAAITFLSWKLTKKETRAANRFTWHPILEVGKLFAGIFVTMAPLIAMLRAGAGGPLHSIIGSLTAPDGSPVNAMYYWSSGILSGFLDSAPAYLVFFQTAAAGHGNTVAAAHFMMQQNASTLIAITAGASFMGALSYIGNAPNMMVKAIAEENSIRMPSFFGYMVWSFGILIPLFFAVQWLFIK